MRSRIVADPRAPSIIRAVHLIVPFAAASSPAARAALSSLDTPALDDLLADWHEVGRDDGDDESLDTPHERALARAIGWRVAPDAALPWAARAARADGIDVGAVPWALLTPTHWRVGTDAIHLADPRALALDATTSRALFELVRPLFESEGFTLAWGAPLRWYASHADLAGLRTASLDRVIGRNVDRWLGETRSPMSRRLRRLQSEAQLVFHAHPVNEAREARGEPVVNSFWLSGCGRARAFDAAAEPSIDATLRTPLLAADWVAWAEAWQRLDAEAIARAGSAGAATVTLCGERTAARYEARPQGLVQRLRRRWQAPEAHAVLEGL